VNPLRAAATAIAATIALAVFAVLALAALLETIFRACFFSHPKHER
jgi:hypothetical protein